MESEGNINVAKSKQKQSLSGNIRKLYRNENIGSGSDPEWC